jgi:hypothetical protein
MRRYTAWIRRLPEQYATPCLLWVFATAWNFMKPFHIDDTVHLEIAQWIAAHPAHPMSGYIDSGDRMVPIWQLNQPHLFFYLMAVVGKVFGWREIPMHALEALFAFGAISFIYGIARHLRPDHAGYLTTLAVASPAFVAGQNVMVDIPLLAAVCGCYWALLAYHGADVKRYLVASLMVSVAILIKYSAVILIPAVYLDMLLRAQLKYWKIGLTPLVILSLWSAFNEWDYGHIHILTRQAVPGSWSGTIVERAMGLLFCIGASIPTLAFAFFPGPQEATRLRWMQCGLRILGMLSLGLLIVAVAYIITSVLDSYVYQIVKVLLSISAIGVLVTAIRGGWISWIYRDHANHRTPELGVLVYWALSFLAFAILFAPFMATRHVLPSLPGIVMLAGIGSAAVLARPITSLAAAVAWTSIVAAGDWWTAAAYRDAAFRVRESLPAQAKVWALGHWGWEWYARAAGMHGITEITSVNAGDYVVWPVRTGIVAAPESLALTKAGETVIKRKCCVSYLIAGDAGWYTSGYWRLPWLPTREALDVVEIHLVVRRR